MKATRKLFKDIYNRELKVTPKGAINQTQRNALKSEVIDSFIEDLIKGLGVEVLRLDKGIALNIPHIDEGALPITIDLVFKSTTYDIVGQAQAYQEDKALKEQNALDRERKRKIKFENDTNARALAKLNKVK